MSIQKVGRTWLGFSVPLIDSTVWPNLVLICGALGSPPVSAVVFTLEDSFFCILYLKSWNSVKVFQNQ